MADEKWQHDLSIQFRDGQIVEVVMTEGDRFVIQFDHPLSQTILKKIHHDIGRWLDGVVPALILEPGINLAIIRTGKNVKAGC